jgi:hypothetical protein
MLHIPDPVSYVERGVELVVTKHDGIRLIMLYPVSAIQYSSHRPQTDSSLYYTFIHPQTNTPPPAFSNQSSKNA